MSAAARVLITGGTGFIGGRIAERFASERGATVHVLARSPEKAARLAGGRFRVVTGDMRDAAAAERAAEGCDLVVHGAHAFGLPMDEAVRVNVGGARNLLRAAHAAGARRFIYLSSVAVYGRTPPDGTDESRPLVPTGDPYADSKIAVESEVRAFGRRHGFPIVILRPAIVYGPRSKVWSLGIIHALRAKHPIVVGRGDGICNVHYIDNLVDAVFLAAEVDAAAGEAFIVTDGAPCTWAEFVGHYARMLGMDAPPSCPAWLARFVASLFHPIDRATLRLRRTPAREPARFLVRATRLALRLLREPGLRICQFTPKDLLYFTHRAAFDIGKARDVLGYAPRVGLEEGMARTEAWLRKEGYLP
jgi:nucleoside-diphosphate-sugar epimerase